MEKEAIFYFNSLLKKSTYTTTHVCLCSRNYTSIIYMHYISLFIDKQQLVQSADLNYIRWLL